MIGRSFCAAALALCCVAGVGCQAVTNCGEGCGRGCSMAFQKYDCACDNACGSCCSEGGACDSDQASGSGCDGAGGCCGKNCGDPPIRSLMGLFCGCTGCDECYWNEWHNDPPSLCEPCDRCGNYIGPGNTGYYQAPYRRHDGMVAKHAPSVPPLEVAERKAADESVTR